MPHRVATFFRSHALDVPASDRKKKKVVSLSSSDFTRNIAIVRHATIASSSSSSINSAETASMIDTPTKRRSLVGHNSPRSSSRSIASHVPAKLVMDIESPPLVFYGLPSQSSGALLSGQLKLNISEEKMAIESFQMRMVVDVKMKKPFHAHCNNCILQSTELMSWTFLQAPTTLNQGEHNFPFSFLLPGHLPATTNGALSSIDYVLKALVTPKSGDPISLTNILSVKRSIQSSEVPRQSIRIFPPTNLTSHVELPSVIHPIGEFKASVRVDGIIRPNVDARTQTHWKLKRLTWRLDESQSVISPACPKHGAKAGAGPDEKKGLAHQDVRTLNIEELKSGWKADYTAGADGSIEVEFPFSIRADSRPVCDVKAADGTEISHSLVIEMIVAEEIAPMRKPSQAVATGAARVLRMNFNIIVTERGGLGISWDEEQPPLYENVPASPPGYGRTEEYVGTPIPDYEELETLTE